MTVDCDFSECTLELSDLSDNQNEVIRASADEVDLWLQTNVTLIFVNG